MTSPTFETPVSRRVALKTAASGAASLLGVPMLNRGRYQLFADRASQYSARTIDLMQRAIVVDMLSPLTLDFPRQEAWFAKPERFTQADFQRWRDSGITVMHPAVGMDALAAHERGLMFFGAWNAFLAGSDAYFLRIDSTGDLRRVKTSGKIGVILGLQNSEHFRMPGDVTLFHGLGQRVSQLTYNSRNLIGNGSTERRDEGISDFGVAIIGRMNAVGMAVDVSHCGDRTTLEAFELSNKPVLITHSNCRALVPGHPRCKTDEAIRAVGRVGSVIGITGVRNFVKAAEPTTIEHALDHFDHVRRLIGSEYLGVGSDIDLDGYDDMPADLNRQLRAAYKGTYGFRERLDIEGLDHPRRMFDLTEGLIRRRYSDDEILGILGGNFVRVLGEIWGT